MSKVGNLQNGRSGHGAIFDGDKFLIIGGIGNEFYGPVRNEVCTLKDSKMTCVEQTLALFDRIYYPELFLVAETYGKDVGKC